MTGCKESPTIPQQPPPRPPFDSRGKRIGIFVIAYNAESHITETLNRIPEDVWKAVTVTYIIDDCSVDETVRKALEFDRWKDKLVVLRNRVNQRYGGNQKLGYQYAIDQKLDVVVMLHADGQYAPEFLPNLLDPIVKGEADVVLGSRMMQRENALKGGMPKYKFLGNIVLTKIENALSGMRLSEFHSGYRAYSAELLRKIHFWENSDEWHFDTQILLQAHDLHGRILEVPIPTYYGSEICHVNGIAYGLNVIWTSFGYFLFRNGIYYSRKYDMPSRGRRYFEKFGDEYSSHSLIWKHLQAVGIKGAKVLELGVGDASLTRRLAEAGAVVDGVELDETSVELARPHCRKVMHSNLNDIAKIEIADEYDIIVAADVLEHLADPEFVLSRLKRYLKRGGLLVVSLPNVANLYVRLNLLMGRFPYHSKGLLDRSHLHFYTLLTMRRLLRKTGWVVESSEVTVIPVAVIMPWLTRMPWRLLAKALYVMTRMFKGLLAYQGIFYCRNPNLPELL